MTIILTLLLISSATLLILRIPSLAIKLPFSRTDLPYINEQARYQLLLLLVSFVVVVIAYFLNKENFFSFVSVGNIAAPAGKVIWLGIGDGESWLWIGLILSFFITLGTFSFIYLNFARSGAGVGLILPYIPWILLFSLTNSFAEEAIYRLGIIVPLFGVIDTGYLLLISAIAFGLPHLRGMPNGIIGVLMASVLGWVLAKSVIETHGIFWAWSIHFLQDVVIFGALTMVAAHKITKEEHL